MALTIDGSDPTGDLGDLLAAKADYPSGGTDGQALTKSGTTTAWASVGGLVPLASETITTQSSVSINNCFSNAYENYRIVVVLVGSGDVEVRYRLRASGTDATGSNYAYQYLYANGTNVSALRATGETGARVFGAVTAYRAIGAYDLTSPAVARPTNAIGFQVYAANTVEWLAWSNYHSLSTAYDGITFYTTSGTISGTIRIYGYKD